MSASTIITVTVPVAFRISVEVPANGPATAETIAASAAEHFAHVSRAQVRAFNEVNRIHAPGAGVVTAVTSGLDAARQSAA
ncbi:hypothetical protein [Azospirillum halopraeferens]|uniref:hypothetical protein n=1 Tax=Azospirillum halopraeferens TaxID=34010 RepID=UPI0004185EA3|nr:hypothetical protein [Azospirillum halopraeferens]